MWSFKWQKNLCTCISVNLPHQAGRRLFTIANEKFIPKSTDRGESSTVLAFTFGKAHSIMFEFKIRAAC